MSKVKNVKPENVFGNTNAELYKNSFTAAMFITLAECLYHVFNLLFHKLNIKKDGNAKLKNTKTVRFLIWNIPEIGTCSGNCPHFADCYAFTNSLQRGLNVQRCRIRNYLETLNPNFVTNMIGTIEDLYQHSTALKRCEKIYFRIHESGDFYSLEYLQAWYKIAEHFLHSNKKIVFQAYTHSWSFDWFTEENKPSNFVIRYSDCKDAEYSYTVVNSLENIPEDNICKCADCANCGKCYNREIKKIFVKAHSVQDGIIYRKAAKRCKMSLAYIRWINLIKRCNNAIRNNENKKQAILALIQTIYG